MEVAHLRPHTGVEVRGINLKNRSVNRSAARSQVPHLRESSAFGSSSRGAHGMPLVRGPGGPILVGTDDVVVNGL